MESQSLLHGFCSNTYFPSVSSSTSSIFTSSSHLVQTRKWVSLKSNILLSLSKIGYNKKLLQCKIDALSEHDASADFGDSNIKSRRKKLAVFVSGGGSNFKAIHKATLDGSVHGDIVVIVTNKRGCGGAEYARGIGIPVVLFPQTKDEQEGLSIDGLIATLREFKVDYILLAGYLKLIPAELVRDYLRRILNIHPSLLPAFGGQGYYGLKVHKAVIASGARYSGPTVHFVDEHYDEGRIIAQRVVPVHAFDTAEELAARVLHEEHYLYVDVVAALCEERIIWRDDGVPLIQSKDDPNRYS